MPTAIMYPPVVLEFVTPGKIRSYRVSQDIVVRSPRLRNLKNGDWWFRYEFRDDIKYWFLQQGITRSNSYLYCYQKQQTDTGGYRRIQVRLPTMSMAMQFKLLFG